MANNGKKLKRENFDPLLQKNLETTLTTNMFVNGFRKCGIHPFNADAVDYSRLLRNVEPEERVQNTDTIKHIHFIEKKLGNKLQQFQNCHSGMWDGNGEDKALYEFWKSLRNENVNTGTEINLGNNNNTENKNWMDLDNLLNDNSVVDCHVDREGHLFVDTNLSITTFENGTENKDCDTNQNCKGCREIPSTSSSDTKAYAQTESIRNNDLISCQEQSSRNYDIHSLNKDSLSKDFVPSSENGSISEEPHALEHSTPEKNPEVPDEVTIDISNKKKPQFEVDLYHPHLKESYFGLPVKRKT